MNTMKAAIYTGIEQIGIQEVEYAPPAPGYVGIDTKQTGICGSDLHSYFGHWDQSHTHAAGHETCGTVIELGKVSRDFNRAIKLSSNFSHTVDAAFTAEKAITITVWNANGFHTMPTGGSRSIQMPILQDSLSCPKA